ncbi:MAG: accessory factor UbiK family protein [Thalassobaculales bacterium]
MQSENRLVDELAKVAGGALGMAAGLRAEVEQRLKEQLQRVMLDMDLVTREEFEVVRAMAQRAREENEALATRIAALEAAMPAPAADENS